MTFAGRVAVVTGATSGIGRATAARLAADGARVLVTDIDADQVRETVTVIERSGGEAAAHRADLADQHERAQVIAAALDRFGRVDVLVNNAAYLGPRLPLVELPDAELERVLAVNLTATAILCREAGREMANRGSGAIINITAIQERLPLATYAAYGASKGGVSALTRALAVELSPLGVRVNAVAPGVIDTSTSHAGHGTSIDTAAAAPATLLRRNGTPDELAAAVAFLASDEASFITGAVLPVDGGRVISRRVDPFASS